MKKLKTKSLSFVIVIFTMFCMLSATTLMGLKSFSSAAAEEFLAGKDSVVYYVNCPYLDQAPNPGVNMAQDATTGKYQTNLDQEYKLDAKSGYSWGRFNSSSWYKADWKGSANDQFKTAVESRDNSEIQYKFELPKGRYEVTVGSWEEWWDKCGYKVRVNDQIQEYDLYKWKYDSARTFNIRLDTENVDNKCILDVGVSNSTKLGNNWRVYLSFIIIKEIHEAANITVDLDSTFTADTLPTTYNNKAITWKKDLSLLNTAIINNYVIEGKAIDLFGDGVDIKVIANIIVRPKNLLYFINCGTINLDFSKFQNLATTVGNPPIAEGITYGYTEICENSKTMATDLYDSLMYVFEKNTELRYKLTLAKGRYNFYLGLYDLWSNDNKSRATDISLKDNQYKYDLANDLSYYGRTKEQFTKKVEVLDGAQICELALNHKNTTQPLLSYIMVEEIKPHALAVEMKATDNSALNDKVSVSGVGEYYEGDDITVKANMQAGSGYLFYGWYNGAELVSREQLFTTQISVATTLTAKFIPLASQPISIHISQEIAVDIKKEIVADVKSGSGYSVKLTAPLKAPNNQIFDGYYIGKNLISKDLICSVPIMSKYVNVAVKYKESTKKTVIFMRNSDLIVSIDYVDSFDGYDPTKTLAPARPGYTFKNWQLVESVEQDVRTYIAIYQKNTEVCTVSVGEIKTTYNKNDVASVTAISPTFSYWTENGKIVSYDKTYSFKVLKNSYNLVEVSNGNTKIPSVVIDTEAKTQYTDGSKNSIIANALTAMPDGFKIVERGFIGKYIGAELTTPRDNLSLTADEVGIIKILSNSTNQFVGKFNLSTKNSNYAVSAYLIYKDVSGNLVTVYSDIVYFDL